MKKSILNWLDEQANNGNTLSIKWEGGGDSGWAYFEVDGEQVENEYTEALVNHMHDHLDYGSWAGEFQANGTAIYNPETKCFEGTDYYGEDTHSTIEEVIQIPVPKDFWFDTFHIEVETYAEESTRMAVSFNVKNGFLVHKHSDFCSNLEKELVDTFDTIFDKYFIHRDDFRGCTDSWVFNRSEAREDGDMLVFTINNIEVMTVATDEKYVVMEVTDEMVKDIDKSLKGEHAK